MGLGIPAGIPGRYWDSQRDTNQESHIFIPPESQWESHLGFPVGTGFLAGYQPGIPYFISSRNPGGIPTGIPPAGFPHIFSLGFTEIKLHLLKPGGGVTGQGGYLTHYTLKT